MGSPVNLGAEGLPANGVDVALFHVEVVDGAGLVVPNADHAVSFEVSGPGAVVGTGNGDPASHVPDHSTTRPAFHGRVMALVRADDTGEAAQITVTASAAGLTPASATLRVVTDHEAPPRL